MTIYFQDGGHNGYLSFDVRAFLQYQTLTKIKKMIKIAQKNYWCVENEFRDNVKLIQKEADIYIEELKAEAKAAVAEHREEVDDINMNQYMLVLERDKLIVKSCKALNRKLKQLNTKHEKMKKILAFIKELEEAK